MDVLLCHLQIIVHTCISLAVKQKYKNLMQTLQWKEKIFARGNMRNPPSKVGLIDFFFSMARSVQTVENSHNFFNDFYTWYKSLLPLQTSNAHSMTNSIPQCLHELGNQRHHFGCVVSVTIKAKFIFGFTKDEENLRNCILLPKLFWPTVRKKCSKGQIKPKADWCAVDSPIKRTNELVLFAFLHFTPIKTNSFIRFLGESTVSHI